MSDKEIIEKKKFLREMLENQLKNISVHRRLLYKDLSRITKYIETSIFDENECCVWNGYVTNAGNAKKGTYINFFFRNRKVALHRLLYDNFIGVLGDDAYLKFSCDTVENRGKCCNVKHMIKYKYNAADKINNEIILDASNKMENGLGYAPRVKSKPKKPEILTDEKIKDILKIEFD